ncbi:alpha/beta fold hydrolase [Dactylosporangium sucinum]|uniref:Alpha/beta hydrolase n=1 Tax=Dactylosporangium sucinum TaxID=1424081 RepID=A0A917UFU3_9ACTN|nr:alpha/beta hydrolase [Dactylosporangium sucinum]GGM89730.1 alpha/beta hydrolase [Dactylosporangium sucinum]
MSTMTPEWFSAALGSRPDEGTTDVDGTSITYRAWGDAGMPGVVLVHGGAAHAHWWDHIGPLLVEGRRRVVAVDLSGHGDSGRRERYELDIWAEEVLAAAASGGIEGPPVVIGHSMGGFVTLRAAALFGSRLHGAVVVDSPVRELTPEERAARAGQAFGPLRVYATLEEGMTHFRSVPDQPALDYVTRHVARHSLRRVDDGWTWKFDPRVFVRAHLGPSVLTRLECRIALLRGEHGILSQQMSEVMYDRLGRAAPVIEIPDAGHHIMLDQPLALATALRTLLADWDHSQPSTGPVAVGARLQGRAG